MMVIMMHDGILIHVVSHTQSPSLIALMNVTIFFSPLLCHYV
jgi:hypothetical protein